MPHFYPADWSQNGRPSWRRAWTRDTRNQHILKKEVSRFPSISSIKQRVWLSLKHGQWKWPGPDLSGSRTVQGFSNFKKTKSDWRAFWREGKQVNLDERHALEWKGTKEVLLPTCSWLPLSGICASLSHPDLRELLVSSLSIHSGKLWTQPTLHFIVIPGHPCSCDVCLILSFPLPIHSAPPWSSSNDPHWWSWFRAEALIITPKEKTFQTHDLKRTLLCKCQALLQLWDFTKLCRLTS